MPRPGIPAVKKSEIVRLHLGGLTRDEAARKAGVSAGSASSLISEFIDDADSTTLSEASSRYGVREVVEALHNLGVQLRKQEVTVPQAKQGVELVAKASRLGIGIEKLDDLVAFCEKITVPGFPIDRIIQASIKLSKMEDAAGLEANSIVTQYESRLAESQELEARIQTLNSEIQSLVSEKEVAAADLEAEKARLAAQVRQTLEQHRMTLERVDRVWSIEQALKKYGVEIEKPESLLRLLDVVEQLRYDPKKAVECMTEVDSLQSLVQNLRDEKGALEREITGLTAQKVAMRTDLEKTSAELQKAKFLLETRDKLLEKGYTDSSLSTLADLTVRLGMPEEVFNALKCYESLESLEAKRVQLGQTIGKLSTEESELRKSVGEMRQRLKLLRQEHEYAARKCAELKKELESYDAIVKVALSLSALSSGDQEIIKDTSVDAVISLLEAIRPWCSWKQSELEKERPIPIEISVGTLCSFLIDGLRKIRGG